MGESPTATGSRIGTDVESGISLPASETPPRTTRFTVIGIPVAQGSMIPLNSKSTGKAMMIPSNKKGLREWRKAVAEEAGHAHGEAALLDGPLVLQIIFYLPRPKSVSIKKRPLPFVKPDLSKLVRAVEDACTGKVWVDDAQVTSLFTRKRYAVEQVGATVVITEDRG